MKRAKTSAIVRRSVALPRTLVEEVSNVAPAQLRDNFNRLVSTALREYIEFHRNKEFQQAMQEMAADPQIQAECSTINREFAQFDPDGLGD